MHAICRPAVVVVLLAGLVGMGFQAGFAGKARANSLSAGLVPGDTAPDFTARDLAGGTVVLGELLEKRRAVVVNFWGLRCGECIQEMPSLSGIYDRYKSEGLEILGVNVDGVGPKIINAQLPKVGAMPSYAIIVDEDLVVSDLYKLNAAPLTILVSSDGKVVYSHEGYKPGDEKELENQIVKLLH
jgi:peroxiredoxin